MNSASRNLALVTRAPQHRIQTPKHRIQTPQRRIQTPQYKEGWTFHLVLAAIALPGIFLPVGYNFGVTNIPAKTMTIFCNESVVINYGVVLEERWLRILWSFVVSVYILGMCIGSMIGSKYGNTLGRKMLSVIAKLILIAGGVLFFYSKPANSVEMLILGRLLVGTSGGLSMSIIPTYITELAPPSFSGTMNVFCIINSSIGMLLAQVMGLDCLLGGPEDWRDLFSVGTLIVFLTLPILLLIPDSPRYFFVVKKDRESAIRELCRVRGATRDMLRDEINLLQEELLCSERAASNGDSWSMLRVLKDKRLRLPLWLVCSMQVGQQTTGINAVLLYSQTIFIRIGLSDHSAQYATIGCGFLNTVAALLTVKLMSRFGRRPLLLVSAGADALLLAVFFGCSLFIDSFWWVAYVSVVVILLFVLAFGIGLGPKAYLICSELFEGGPRSAVMAWSTLTNSVTAFVVTMTFTSIQDAIGPYTFLVFLGCTIALFVFQKYHPQLKKNIGVKWLILLFSW